MEKARTRAALTSAAEGEETDANAAYEGDVLEQALGARRHCPPRRLDGRSSRGTARPLHQRGTASARTPCPS